MERSSSTLWETSFNDSRGYFDQVASGSSSASQRLKSCFSVADYLLSYVKERKSGVDNLKLQKLLYYAQAWHLGLYDSPLFEEDFQAWIHGPVIPDLYDKYADFGWQDIDDIKSVRGLELSSLSSEDKDFLNEVVQEYLDCDDYELEQMIRVEVPWNKTRDNLAPDEPSHKVIKKEWIKEYYGARAKEQED